MKFIATTSDKISTIPVANGQMIFSQDDRVIYLDTTVRTEYRTIIMLATEQTRTDMISPVKGFYFVEETAILWNYANGNWTPLNQSPEEKLIIGPRPVVGRENIIYVDDGQLYQWSSSENNYYRIGEPTWHTIL